MPAFVILSIRETDSSRFAKFAKIFLGIWDMA